MRYRKLGSIGIDASVITLGTHQFSGEWGVAYSPADVEEIVKRAGELGVNVIDTAECYGNHSVEAMIGQAIASERDKWILATKFGHRSHGPFDKTDAWSAEDVVRQLEDSLRALATDHIDIYQFHSGPNAAFDNEALWEALARQVSLGKIRHLGVSLGGDLTIKGDVHQLEKGLEYGAAAAQIVYNRLSREAEKDILPFCADHGIGVIARIPLSRGLLSGKYAPGTVFPKGDIRAGAPPEFNEKRLREVEEIKRTEVPPGTDMAQWAIGWCLGHPAVTSVAVGCKNVRQLEANAAAADVHVERDALGHGRMEQ